MQLRITTLSAILFLTAASVRCFAQQVEELPDSDLTREQWQQRIENARRRSQEFVATAGAREENPDPPDQKETEAANRAMRDPTLRNGDIVATQKGLFVFVGHDEQHQATDFVSAPNQHRR